MGAREAGSGRGAAAGCHREEEKPPAWKRVEGGATCEGGRMKAQLSSTEDEGHPLISPGEEGKRGRDLRIQWDRRLTSGGNTEWPGSPQEGRHNVGELDERGATLCPAWLSGGPSGGG